MAFEQSEGERNCEHRTNSNPLLYRTNYEAESRAKKCSVVKCSAIRANYAAWRVTIKRRLLHAVGKNNETLYQRPPLSPASVRDGKKRRTTEKGREERRKKEVNGACNESIKPWHDLNHGHRGKKGERFSSLRFAPTAALLRMCNTLLLLLLLGAAAVASLKEHEN